MNKNQYGFGVVVVVIIVLVLGIIGFTAWKVADRINTPVAQANTPAQASNSKQTSKAKLSDTWLLRESDNASIRVPDGFQVLAAQGDTLNFVLPDSPEGTLKYEKGTTATVVGEPHKEFGLGLIASYNSAGLNHLGSKVREFQTYSGLPVTVEQYKREQPFDPNEASDIIVGATYVKYTVTKGDNRFNVDYVYQSKNYLDIIDEMVKSIDIK
jgi:hypothetical protein